MRRQPRMQPYAQQVMMTSAFYGYNHNEIIGNGEMYNEQNMGNEEYPLLATRRKRGISSYDVAGQTPVPLTGIHGRDQLVHIRGTKVFYNFDEVQGLTVTDTDGTVPKTIVSFGAYVLIFPDRKYFNTVHLSDYGDIDRTYQALGQNIELTMCRGDGTDYDMTEITVDDEAPDSPDNGDLWIDQSGDNDVLRQYYSATMEWLEVATTYVKIKDTATGGAIGAGLSEYDAVTISGLEAVSTADDRVKAQVEALNGSKVVYGCGNDYIMVIGLISQTQSALKSGNTVKADRKMPAMDFIIESNNRLWGCRYGWDSASGTVINEIRCSKLGDFRNWETFLGISTDSWVAGVGTDGPFTGAAVQRGYPVFLKENCIHRVSGSTPGSFSITTTVCRGVQDGSGKSVCVVNEAIYYKSRKEVMMYDGSMPVSVGDQLGDVAYSDARAGALDGKYYISMKDKDNHWHLFNYDTVHGQWNREDATHALGFAAVGGELFYIDADHNTLVSVKGSVGTEEADFDWAAEFDLYGAQYTAGSMYDSPQRVRNAKYISMFKIRMSLDEDAKMSLWIKYDNEMSRLQGTRKGSEMRTFVLPVVPRRCDHIRFKIVGHGGAKIYSISRILEVGGDGV